MADNRRPLVPYEGDFPWYLRFWNAIKEKCCCSCRNFFRNNFVNPIVNTVSGSNLPYLSWAVICVVVFFILIITKGIHETQSEMEKRSTHLWHVNLKSVLAIFMFLSFIGIFYCFWNRKKTTYVRYRTLATDSIPARYLLVGLYVFGLGTLLLNMRMLLYFIHAKKGSCQISEGYSQVCWLDILYSVFRFLFVVLQIAFLQSFWCATFDNKWTVKLLLFHTMATNICIWLMNVAEETHIFQTDMKKISRGNATVDHFQKSLESFEGTLTPFTLEYSLIVAGILLGIIGEMKSLTGDGLPDFGDDESTNTGVTAHTYVSLGDVVGNHRQGSQPGLLFGIVFSVFLLVSEITIGFTDIEEYHTYLYIFHIFYVTLFIIMTHSVWRIMTALQRFTKIERPSRPDDKLLIFSLAGGLAFDVIVTIATSSCKNKFGNPLVGLMLTAQILQFLERIFQTWILVLSHKYDPLVDDACKTTEAKRIRQHSLFLLCTNLGIWALDTFFEMKNFGVSSYPCGPFAFGVDWWDKIQAFTYPICIFYRFHAATMSFDLWAHFRFQRQQ